MLLTFARKIEVTSGGLAALRLHHHDKEIFEALWNMGQPYVVEESTWLPSITQPKILFVTILVDANEYGVTRREWWVYYSWSPALTIEVIP